MELNDEYWSNRYLMHQTGWDLHQASPPICAYIDQWTDTHSRVLIPGCGNAYEAEYLLQKGFTNITLLDLSAVIVAKLKNHFSGRGIEVIHADFFGHKGVYDLILEQTFFCALPPHLREAYCSKMHSLLSPGGRLSGVLFNKLFQGGPPFGGTLDEYQLLFSKNFEIHTMAPCYNSIAPRAGAEVFIILGKYGKTL